MDGSRTVTVTSVTGVLPAAARTSHGPPRTQDLTAEDGEPEIHCVLVYALRYASAMSKTVPVREFRTHLADLLDEVADRREHITVTRRGRPAAVMVPVDEYEALEETAEILSDEPTLAAIRRGLDDLAAGEVVSLDEVRAEQATRARS
jgi:antitoxin YefM